MTDSVAKKKRAHPPKLFSVPPDVRVLGSYSGQIIASMRAEYRSRMNRQSLGVK